jgi:hypothetical protein
LFLNISVFQLMARKIQGRTKSDGIGFERAFLRGPKGEIQEVFRTPGVTRTCAMYQQAPEA